MNIRTEPFLGAAAFGIVVAVVYTVIDTALGYSQSPPSYTAFGNSGSCLITLFVGLGSGILYAFLHRQQAPLTSGVGATGGAAAGGLALLISGIFGVLVAVFLVPDVLAQSLAAQGFSPDIATESQDLLRGSMLLFAGGAACGLALIGTIMGAVGGAIGAALFAESGSNR